MLQGQKGDQFAALYANIAKQKEEIARQKAKTSGEETQSVQTQQLPAYTSQ